MSFLGVIIKIFYLQDKYGRKPAYLVSLGIICIGVIGINISNSIEMYIVMNFILGFGAMPPYLLNYIIINETSGKNFR
jgi:MFS family permease